MAGVYVDIPGIGSVEAKNAASEKTLQDILKIMKGFDNELKGGKQLTGEGKGDKSTGKTGAGSNAGTKDNAKKQAEAEERAGRLGKAFSGLTEATKTVAGGMLGATAASAMLIQQFANVGDSLTSAAGTFRALPIVGNALGNMFSAVAGAVETTGKAYQSATAAGATFGGSVNNFAKASSAAGMTMEQFGQVIANNRDGMLAFGGTSEEGAKNFAKVSSALRQNAGDLYALGFSTKDINEGLGKYGSLLRAQGLQGTKTNAELAQGAKSYMKELDLLAKATGQSRSEIEARQAALAKDAQFQAAMAGQSEEVRKSFMALTTGMPKGLESFTKDMLANGTATTEENQKLLSQLPLSAGMLTQMQQKMQRGEAVTIEERQALNNMMKEEGAKNLKNIKQAGAASSELTGMVNGLAATQEINTDALKKGTKEQEEAARKTDEQNKRMEEAKAKLAEFSNGFQMALANSGLLDLMMKGFEMMANLVTTYVVPTFQILGSILTDVGSYLIDNLKPVFQSLSEFISGTLYPIFLQVAGVIMADIVPILQEMGQAISEYVVPFLQDLGAMISENVMPVLADMGSFIMDNLTPILLGLGTALGLYGVYLAATTVAGWIQVAQLALANVGLAGLAMAALTAAAPFLAIGAAVAAIVGLFIYLYKTGWDFGTAIDAMKDGFARFQLKLSDLINGLLVMIPNALGGISEEEAKKRAEVNEATRKDLDDRAEARDKQREANAKERDSEEKKQKREEESAKVDAKLHNLKNKHAGKLEDANKKEEDAKNKAAASKDVNTNDPIALLKAEAAQQQSGLIKDAPKTEVAKVETARKEVEAKGEKAAADAKAVEDTKKESGGSTAPGKPAPTTQESAESLLASLNTKLDQLIKVNKTAVDVQERQLTATQGLSSDVFASA